MLLLFELGVTVAVDATGCFESLLSIESFLSFESAPILALALLLLLASVLSPPLLQVVVVVVADDCVVVVGVHDFSAHCKSLLVPTFFGLADDVELIGDVIDVPAALQLPPLNDDDAESIPTFKIVAFALVLLLSIWPQCGGVVADVDCGGDVDRFDELFVDVVDAFVFVEFAARSRAPVFCCCSRCNLKMNRRKVLKLNLWCTAIKNE